jgi:hypothetical protein
MSNGEASSFPFLALSAWQRKPWQISRFARFAGAVPESEVPRNPLPGVELRRVFSDQALAQPRFFTQIDDLQQVRLKVLTGLDSARSPTRAWTRSVPRRGSVWLA